MRARSCPDETSRTARAARAARAVALALGVLHFGCADGASLAGVEDLLGGAGATGESRVVAGLKQALQIGTERAVEQTSRANGFLSNDAIRIGMPESLDGMAKGLRAIGFGQQLDEFEVAMNRAAEEASGEAAPVFWEAIGNMSFQDARGILDGGETAATDYFERVTREPLAKRFEPIVAARMQNVGVVARYNELVGRYAALPFAQKPSLSLEQYVTGGALDGLFHVLGQEERRIREDPAARTTDLLREVFRSAD